MLPVDSFISNEEAFTFRSFASPVEDDPLISFTTFTFVN